MIDCLPTVTKVKEMVADPAEACLSLTTGAAVSVSTLCRVPA